MNLKEEIEKYSPITEQELKDKETFLMYFDLFEDVVTRKNEIAHFTSSAFIVNNDMTKVLMIYHNIYNSWAWVGGHADGETDLLSVAIKETAEETGITKPKVLNSEIYAIDTLPVLGHVKRGKYVSAHVHLSVAYIFMVDDKQPIRIKEDENSSIEWIPIEKCIKMATEPHMKPVYEKIINKLRNDTK